jgi:hypothetical protein
VKAVSFSAGDRVHDVWSLETKKSLLPAVACEALILYPARSGAVDAVQSRINDPAENATVGPVGAVGVGPDGSPIGNV